MWVHVVYRCQSFNFNLEERFLFTKRATLHQHYWILKKYRTGTLHLVVFHFGLFHLFVIFLMGWFGLIWSLVLLTKTHSIPRKYVDSVYLVLLRVVKMTIKTIIKCPCVHIWVNSQNKQWTGFDLYSYLPLKCSYSRRVNAGSWLVLTSIATCTCH